MKKTEHKYTNLLIHESSPYLLQHAHNPVNWYAWNNKTLEKAKKEDKLILISIGYSACHWCHVMEHQSFEDETVAKLMNDYFICIKIDREERPDIDQVYMLAVQLMTGQGGWPLNCFTLPDGRPIYGGTYFPKNQWINILLNLADLYKNEKDKAIDYANQLTEGIKLAELVKVNNEKINFSEAMLHECYNNWKIRFDNEDGGSTKAPKFPLPNNYQFLLQYAFLFNNQEALKHVELTLQKMANGGIYDQIGGGFARYSVDGIWKVPHFEKMLYDNAQLVSLYAQAFQATKNEQYKNVVTETLEFIERELYSIEGAFFSALDADSDDEEGKFYVWKKEELITLLKDKYTVFADYYNINERGYWEHQNYILLKHDSNTEIAKRNNISEEELKQTIDACKKILLKKREKRTRPGLDDKILTSWNALMLIAYTDAYKTFGKNEYLNIAIKNASFITDKLLQKDGSLFHSYKNGKASINGFLEDYCFSIEAFIRLYEITYNEAYLNTANTWIQYCIVHFMDESSGMFYFTSTNDDKLITRKMELSDNVIPASNSSIAKSLFILGHYFENNNYIEQSAKMLNNLIDDLKSYGSGYSNWGILLNWFVKPFYEIAIVGKNVNEKSKSIQKHYLPNVIFAGSTNNSTMPLLKNRWKENDTVIYVCKNKSCLLPVYTNDDALKQLQF
ncbi:MAG: thioredoxin domain-containing protein [Bacteroidia bacterium]|nr:thioredoxin domain-containing protein [Bacteroidia bacterium]